MNREKFDETLKLALVSLMPCQVACCSGPRAVGRAAFVATGASAHRRIFSKLSMCKSGCFYPSKYRYMIYYDIWFLSYVTNINQYLCQLSNQVEKEIIAGSDFFLMPSRLENAKEKSLELWTIWTMFCSCLKKADHFSREHT
jgi:hypothetical protein